MTPRRGSGPPTGAAGPCAYLIRPDGHIGYRQAPLDADALVGHLGRTFAARERGR